MAPVIVVCLSTSSLSKEGYVQKEIRVALDVADEKPEGTIFLVPLRLEECSRPSRLAHLHMVDYFQPRGFDRLLAALRARGKSLGLELPEFAGRLVYDSRMDTDTGRWTLFSSVGGFEARIHFAVASTGAHWKLQAFAEEEIGVNLSLNCLAGSVHFSYRAVGGEKCMFCMIPMEETGVSRSGLIEVGAKFQDEPANAFSVYRERYHVPSGHCDGEWHQGAIEFNFRASAPAAFYSIFAPRINEGVKRKGSGVLEVTDMQIYALD